MIFRAKDLCSVCEVLKATDSAPVLLANSGWLIRIFSGRVAVSADHFEPMLAAAGQLLLAPAGTRLVPTDADTGLSGIRFCGSCAFFFDRLTAPLLQTEASVPGVSQALSCIVEAGGAEPAEAFSLLCRLQNFDHAAQPAVSSLTAAAIEAIRKNYANLYGVEELAHGLSVSKSHLVRCFKAQTGTTPGSYLTDIRLQAACQILSSTDCSLELVAQMCGFSGANYFVRVFRQKTGVTPAAFRASQHLPLSSELIHDEIYL